MLTELLIRDETTASLGKTEHTFTVHVSGEKISVRELKFFVCWCSPMILNER